MGLEAEARELVFGEGVGRSRGKGIRYRGIGTGTRGKGSGCSLKYPGYREEVFVGRWKTPREGHLK
jgi:hypothetical protein